MTATPSSMAWPRISVVIPSLNQAAFLEETLMSLLSQDYPNLETIVMDGGSTDGTRAILHRHADRIAHWESQPDRGQSHAINKGMARATGDLRAWLNADDMYLPGTLHAVAMAWRDTQPDVVSGHTRFVGPGGVDEGRFAARPVDIVDILRVRGFRPPQQSTFWTAACWQRFGPLPEDLHYTMDQAYWLRMGAGGARWLIVDRDLALFRHHPGQKTAGLASNPVPLTERRRLIRRFMDDPLCTPALRREARRGLDAVWVKEWRLRQSDVRSRARLWWRGAGALLVYPRCLRVRAFYGTLWRAPMRAGEPGDRRRA